MRVNWQWSNDATGRPVGVTWWHRARILQLGVWWWVLMIRFRLKRRRATDRSADWDIV